ncbi:BlaI/MecI/CopY family transcriptional regulator [Desertihabitans brevis]|uniref:BlaI/MecI/CopY family transcriptional regulator n=1 Tax=Desertihabitans brevis TaxID=2268447 RepID=A0A367YWW1_9ACTN|nr:BlaI/MecI/CopY family transcriptional regulator [Desertihabitans brevis]RCK70310.1 BlaI/MecI/CopY family transcriptional regulator [Desertihabitans brevis]
MATLGELERAVMEQLWAADSPLSVREVHQALGSERELAYTTVMTVLDRLAKKDVVSRERVGRAWMYRPTSTREAMVAEVMHSALVEQEVDRSAALMAFVNRVSPDEMALLRDALGQVEERHSSRQD